MNKAMETIEESKHFQLRQVSDGVYGAISVPGTGSLGNAAIIDLGDTTLVVDSFLSIQAAQDLRVAAEQLTGHPVSYLFNTHWHGDHTFGNQVFASSAQIISTTKTREIMDTVVRERLSRHLSQPEIIYQAIDDMDEKIQQEMNEKLKQEMKWENDSDREYMKMLPDLKYTLPTLTFDQQLTIHGSKRTVYLMTFGGGHTQSDAFLFIPEEKIGVMGDLVLSKHHPVMMYANPHEWLKILNRVEKLGVNTIIPGHGDVCSLQQLHEVRGYITDLLELVREIDQSKLNIENIPVPEAYRGWYFTGDFKVNLQTLHGLMNNTVQLP